MRPPILGALAVATLAACTAGGAPAASGGDVTFTDEGATQQSGYEGRDPKIEIGGTGQRWYVTAYQGQQRTGGYSIRVERMTLESGVLRVRARFSAPSADAIVTQVLTSPSHRVGIAFRPGQAILVDQDGRERARAAP